MKHQSMRDRLDEGEGMVRHEMRHEDRGHSRHYYGEHHAERGIYRNEVEKPEMPEMRWINPEENMGYGMRDFKGDADPIAYGQSGAKMAMEDEKKIHSQFKDYHWE